jgi:hypothetical protein
MAKNSSKSENLESKKDSSIPAPDLTPAPEIVSKRLYFINEIVEWQLTKYIWTGCTNVQYRDDIMSHASELIRQIIRKQGLHTIYPGQDESSFGDLLQTAWVQIERTLYKYRARPHCRRCFNLERPGESLLYSPGTLEYGIKTLDEVVKMRRHCPKCKSRLFMGPMVEPVQGRYAGSETILYRGMSKVFNMWSQIARTVILAHIKKEGRDKKNSGSYINHLGNKKKPVSGIITRLIGELKELYRYDEDGQKVIEALEYLALNDDRPHEGLIGKLIDKSKLPRPTVSMFLKMVKLRSYEISDSLLNRAGIEQRYENKKGRDDDIDKD